jgi:hypothetical protein
MAKEGSAEATIRDIKRKTRRKYNTEEKIRIVIEGYVANRASPSYAGGKG